jgi:acyl carrier protein
MDDIVRIGPVGDDSRALELAALLRQHPDVRAAVVLSVGNGTEGAGLIPYVLASGATRVSAPELQRHLEARGWLHPNLAAVLVNDALPALSTAKVDESSSAAKETVLTWLWAAVLERDAVGLDENVFDLGGSSLHAMQIVSRIEAIFHVELPVLAVFEHPTVREQAALAVAEEAVPGQTEAIAGVVRDLMRLRAGAEAAAVKEGR